MDLQNEKCVMVINENLPLGIIANTAAIMGITMGKQMPEVVGADVYDRTGNEHLGIIEFPVPILKGNGEVIKTIRERLYEPEFSDLTVVDFSDLAQGCKTYDEFIEKIKDVSETELDEAAEMTVVSKPVLGQIERWEGAVNVINLKH